MAKDVRAALVKAYETAKGLSAADAEAQVAALERSHRYQQDVTRSRKHHPSPLCGGGRRVQESH